MVFLGDSMPFAAQPVGGICFCLGGLVLVLCCGARLFTDNNLMVTGLQAEEDFHGRHAEKEQGCHCGWATGRRSLLAVALVFWANVGGMNSGGR